MKQMKPIPSQEDADMDDPEEHFLWGLRNLPMFGGSGTVTNSGFLRKWSEHLWKLGFRHTSWLRGLADENGNIHISQLPKQQLKFQEAFKGPRHQYNNAACWVPIEAKPAAPTQIQDLSKVTLLEQQIYAEQLRRLGVIPGERVPEHSAAELNEGH
ncbi:minor tail protein [Mycobacterium phage HINdeR]|uniref:Uncharacterized protein n=1 Tax=Mycobacterium phage HINdeR TaxID=1327770 RepID=R4JHP7_9CAUD|nr:minor tail protein [Mycobacterium phage HINdeR]AGK87507.1 hypothetical protein PBI_HINDER_28 [Mycobacterium phage HINdeR]